MKTGTIKTLLALAVMILMIIFPIGGTQPMKIILLISIASFILGFFLTHMAQYNSLYNQLIIESPKWNDRINVRKPLTYIQLIGIFLLAAGTGGLAGGLIHGQTVNLVGTVLLATGLGTLTGMYSELLGKKNKISEQ